MILEKDSEGLEYSDLVNATDDFVRKAISSNRYTGRTPGLCQDVMQWNLVIVEEELAGEFKEFCDLNPVPCPLVGVSEVGSPFIERMGREIDLRTALPLYHIYQNGNLLWIERDIKAVWRHNFVSFVIGSAVSFEKALINNGISVRHLEESVTVPLYKTNVMTKKVGAFEGPVVMSMRPVKKEQLERVKTICSDFPLAQGAPLHIGSPKEIGIKDLETPDWGEPVTIKEDEIPVFWGSGVTNQVIVSNAKPDICITHAPGSMLITNIEEPARIRKIW